MVAEDLLILVIALIIIATISLFLAFLQSSSWLVRQGLEYMDCNVFLIFIYYSLGMLSHAFYIVMFGYAMVSLLIDKALGASSLSSSIEYHSDLFVLFLSLAFVFKVIHTLGIILTQTTTDIFFIDWEQPTNERSKVSIWRTYFVANEWNEMQTFRKIGFTFQLLATLFFLEVVGIKNFALVSLVDFVYEDVSITDGNSVPVNNPLFHFAIGGLVYIVVEFIQVIYQVLIHERFISYKIQNFVDLCSMCNISIIIFQHRQYGYYIHGRSVHGRADTDMMDMHVMLKKEKENLTATRGLETGSDLQAFQILTSNKFRKIFESIYQPLKDIRKLSPVRGSGFECKHNEQKMFAYASMREFLSAFIDQSLRDLNYVVKDRLFFETFLDKEFMEPKKEAVFFFNDSSNSFSNVLFYGQEFNLFMFDVILFTFIDYFTLNYILSAIVTYLIGKTLAFIRQAIGRTNLAKKTLVDKRFLI